MSSAAEPTEQTYTYTHIRRYFMDWLLEAETKLPPFFGRHFQMHFLEWKCMNFTYDFTENCSSYANYQYSSIGSDNVLAPDRRQAIIWTNASPTRWRIYAALRGTELKITWWRHIMETFSALLVICVGIHQSTVNSLHKAKASDAELWCFLWSSPE